MLFKRFLVARAFEVAEYERAVTARDAVFTELSKDRKRSL